MGLELWNCGNSYYCFQELKLLNYENTSQEQMFGVWVYVDNSVHSQKPVYAYNFHNEMS